jgi:hypothetical protein
MGPVEDAVRKHIHPPERLRTPGRDMPFTVERFDQEALVLVFGEKETRTPMPWEALEGVPDLLRGRGWVPTTGSFAVGGDISTISGYLKQFFNRETANWVMVVLERAGVVELDRSRPITARLVPNW